MKRRIQWKQVFDKVEPMDENEKPLIQLQAPKSNASSPKDDVVVNKTFFPSAEVIEAANRKESISFQEHFDHALANGTSVLVSLALSIFLFHLL